MASILAPPETGALTPRDLEARFGQIPLWRIVTEVPPGEGTEDDVLRLHAESKTLCELVDGILVRKTMGSFESFVAMQLALHLGNFVHSLKPVPGWVLGEGGMLKLWPERIRIPDVCYISRDQTCDGKFPRDEAIAQLYPDLAVEVLSKSNTRREMQGKLEDYFQSGTRLAWLIDPVGQTAEVYTSPEQKTMVPKGGMLTGDPVLPGLAIPLASLFVTD